MKKCFLISLLFLLIPSFGFAANYYVDASCGSSGNGTTAVCGVNGPWKTLAEAVTGVASGANHTINVAAGTYNEDVADDRSGPGAVEYTDASYRIWQANGTVNSYSFNITGNWVKIVGFTLTGGGSLGSALRYVGNYNWFYGNTIPCASNKIGIVSPGTNPTATYATIESNTFTGCYQVTIDLNGTYSRILNNDISRCRDGTSGEEDGDCFRLFGNNHLIRGNYIHDIRLLDIGSGGDWFDATAHVDIFQTYDNRGGGGLAGRAPLNNSIFERNHIFVGVDSTATLGSFNSDANTKCIFMFEGVAGATVNNITFRNNILEGAHGFHTGNGANLANLYFYNNTFRGKLDHSFDSAAIQLNGCDTAEIYNNIFLDFKRTCGAIDLSSSSNITGGYNSFWNTDSSTVYHPDWPMYTGDQDDVNPLITATTPLNVAANYILQSGSPAKNAGTTIASVTNDYAGTSRPQGEVYDIGAYEYQDATPPIPEHLRIITPVTPMTPHR